MIGGIVGLCSGSFLVTAALRWFEPESALKGRSRCRSCGAALRWFELVPALSYVASRGRCRRCGASIDPIHPLGEIAAAVAGAAPFLMLQPGPAALLAALGWWLLLLALIDAREHLLPDVLTLPLIALGSAWAIVAHASIFDLSLRWVAPTPLESLLGTALGYGAFALLDAVYLKLRGRSGLGRGDAKLLAAAGACLGAAALPNLVLIAALLALLQATLTGRLRRPDLPLPFGPALCLAFWLLALLSTA